MTPAEKRQELDLAILRTHERMVLNRIGLLREKIGGVQKSLAKSEAELEAVRRKIASAQEERL